MAINHLDVKKFIKGECFVCKKICNTDAYVHWECAICYCDEKEKRLKIANKQLN